MNKLELENINPLIRLVYKAGQKGIPLELALQAYELVKESVEDAEPAAPVAKPHKSKAPVERTAKTTPREKSGHGATDETRERMGRIVACLREVGDGGARVEYILEKLGATTSDEKKKIKAQLWYASQNANSTLIKIDPKTYAIK